ncbi:hypothetical protein H9X77_12455 [Clostridium saudiense]|nr:hypothetical protein [Clostridium saudiense]
MNLITKEIAVTRNCNTCPCDASSPYDAGTITPNTEVSLINFNVTLNNVCADSRFGIFVRIYFTPEGGEERLVGIIGKCIDVDDYVDEYTNESESGCLDDVVIEFEDVVVCVPYCFNGDFRFDVFGNYTQCPASDD